VPCRTPRKEKERNHKKPKKSPPTTGEIEESESNKAREGKTLGKPRKERKREKGGRGETES